MMENALSEEIHRMCSKVIDDANNLIDTRVTPEKDETIDGKISLTALRLVEEIEENALNSIRTVVPHGKAFGIQLGDGGELLSTVFDIQEKRHRAGSLSYHIAAHGFGASLAAAVLGNAALFKTRPVISSLNLYAPMIRESTFNDSIVPLLAYAADGRVNRNSKDGTVAIEQTKLFVMNQAAHRGDRPFSGYGCSWPELWAQCFAIAAPKATWEAGEINGAATSQYNDRRARMRFLALPEVADEVCAALESEHALSLIKISPDDVHLADNEQALKSPRHHDLDMRLSILDNQLHWILEKKPNPDFSNYYPGRESFADFS